MNLTCKLIIRIEINKNLLNLSYSGLETTLSCHNDTQNLRSLKATSEGFLIPLHTYIYMGTHFYTLIKIVPCTFW